jgi:predicted metal-binding membrane protein
MRIGSMTTLKRDRLCVLSGFGIVVLVAWLYLVVNPQRADMTGGADGMGMGQGMRAMTEVHPWSTATFALTLAMWAAMMIAMMVPSAAPMALMYAAVARKAAAEQSPVAPTFVFVAGYVAVWAVFSVAATTSQWILDRMALLSSLMVSRSSVLGSGLLIAAGVYQLTPLKRACLEHCRAPAHFIARHWRPGRVGAFAMGVRHGAYCVGCCWVLMALLFVGGVMNLLLIAAIAGFVLFEKTLPFAEIGGRIVGGAMTILGVAGLVVALT